MQSAGCYFKKIRWGFLNEVTFEAGPERNAGQLCDWEMRASREEGQVQRILGKNIRDVIWEWQGGQSGWRTLSKGQNLS